jgi:hypothetical protein
MGGWPENFAVVTACNPRGGGSREDDAMATSALAHCLDKRGYGQHPVTGLSGDGAHEEFGYAVWGCSLEEALELGREFHQNAIFWIVCDRLEVISCETAARELVGLWSERLRS